MFENWSLRGHSKHYISKRPGYALQPDYLTFNVWVSLPEQWVSAVISPAPTTIVPSLFLPPNLNTDYITSLCIPHKWLFSVFILPVYFTFWWKWKLWAAIDKVIFWLNDLHTSGRPSNPEQLVRRSFFFIPVTTICLDSASETQLLLLNSFNIDVCPLPLTSVG